MSKQLSVFIKLFWFAVSLSKLTLNSLLVTGEVKASESNYESMVRSGDVFLVLSSPWARADYGDSIRWMRDRFRVRFALLIFDLVPLRRPEWCDRGVITSFTQWHKVIFPLADQIFSISHATAADIKEWTRKAGVVLPRDVQVIPMGTGFGNEFFEKNKDLIDIRKKYDLPNDFVLFVSTIEIRKNHILLFNVWQKLLADLPMDHVPTLVFAGGIGWLVNDFIQQLENTKWLLGKIRQIKHPTDGDLRALYDCCSFTVFPSLFEGWGLPVSESFAAGRPCVLSNRTSLPEAGGNLGRYFNPESLDDAYLVIREVIQDPDGLAAWRRRVASEFQPVPWTAGANVITDTLAALDDNSVCP